jgi:hypothetical protein
MTMRISKDRYYFTCTLEKRARAAMLVKCVKSISRKEQDVRYEVLYYEWVVFAPILTSRVTDRDRDAELER